MKLEGEMAMNNKIVLAIGAHYDDVEIGCGGSLVWHQTMGDIIYIAILNSDDKISGEVEIRKKEATEAAAHLTADLFSFASSMSCSDKVGALDKFSPDLVYCPFEEDTHQDHIAAAGIARSVARRDQISLLQYLMPTSCNYYPTVFRPIDLRRKAKLVLFHQSQIKRRPDIITRMVRQNKYFGSLIGKDAAEGFVARRLIL